MTLDVLISTHGPEGIRRVGRMNMPSVEGVRYIVTWQGHGGAEIPPSLLTRDDVEVCRVESMGLSCNRNEGISRSRADIYLIADDDLRYTMHDLCGVIEAFEKRPSMDVAVFMYDGPDGKSYPAVETPLFPLPRGYFPTSFEIAVRRSERTSVMRFDPRFGLGSGVFHVGEEDVFLLHGRSLGLDMRFIPHRVTTHAGLTTGLRQISDPRVLRGAGAGIFYYYPVTAVLRVPLKAWRLSRSGRAPLFRSLAQLAIGALYAAILLRKPWETPL